ncbi:ComEA family DNA-binding protein [Paraburkholderia adhaesiva]|uniref:ComEA family DNA-binding protein n=1 Tax=Paraburkholderia adhaesiva TaxID=2883244 RepID=UPI001F2C063F|nr:helix-hairpin-helix domain-containing protein [Paraburkholderia adhaesiva]
MLKKLLMLLVAFGLSMSALMASAVEVNTADQTALESVKGIGPVHAKAIIDERAQHGPFKDADDLVNRVKGIGPKSVLNLEAAGLTINGSSAPPSGKPAATSKSSKAATSAAPAAAANTTPNPATTAAANAPQTASDAKAGKSKHESKKQKAAEAASAAEASPAAAAPGAASETKGKKSGKSKKSKAASDAAASGA